MSVEYEWIEIVPLMLKMQERLYVANGYTRVAHGVAMHRCATTPDCAGGCVMTRRTARAHDPRCGTYVSGPQVMPFDIVRQLGPREWSRHKSEPYHVFCSPECRVMAEACMVCAASGDRLPGHEACWSYVKIAREMRKAKT